MSEHLPEDKLVESWSAENALSVETRPADDDTTRGLMQAKLILEAALLSSSEPLPLADLRKLFDQELAAEVIRKLLDDLKSDWSQRAVELTAVASGWRFRVKPEFARYVQRMNPEKPPRYSRAVLETLAIIAYRQPATRGDIEQIRGVAVSTQIVKTLEERGWIEAVGQREVPGRPALYATTKTFLDDLNLRSLEELPSLAELEATLDMTNGEALTQVVAPSLQIGATQEIATTAIVEIEPAATFPENQHGTEEAQPDPPAAE